MIGIVYALNARIYFFRNKTPEGIVSLQLNRNKISNKDLVGITRRTYLEKRYWVDSSFPFEEFKKNLEGSLKKEGFRLLSAARTTKEVRDKKKKELREEVLYVITGLSSSAPLLHLTLIRRKIPYELPPAAKKERRYKLAIILDDWGYNTKNLEAVLEMNVPLTLSILPNLPYSTLIANKANERNIEVILHMPMEPEAKIRLEEDTLYLSMNRQEIISRIDTALESVPYAKGVSNHEGSKATEDEKLMRIILEDLKSRQLFFVDSFVTNESVCEELAKEMKVRFLKRSIFMDNNSDVPYIKGQIERAIELAGKGDDVIAIGHDRPNTITAIREMLPRLAENDIGLVYISEFTRRR